jgi:hypothetical protein
MRRGDERTKSSGIVPGGDWSGHAVERHLKLVKMDPPTP